MKNIGKAVKFVLVFMVFAVIALFVFRIIVQSDKHRLNEVTGNSVLADCYKNGGDQITAQSHKLVDEISDDGYFMLYSFVYFPEAKQLQVTAQFNGKSVCNYAKKDHTDSDSSNELIISQDDISFTLGISDSSGNEIVPTVSGEEHFWMYTYIRLVFDDVTITDDTDLTVYMYAKSSMISSYVLHYAEQPLESYKLSKAEIKAIAGT